MTAISCTKSDVQASQSEIETKKGGGHNTPPSTSPQVTGLSAVVVSSTQIDIKWSAVAGPTPYYWIYRNNYVGWIIPDTSYSDKSVHPGTTYTYEIAAVVNTVLGPKSVSVTVTTPQ